METEAKRYNEGKARLDLLPKNSWSKVIEAGNLTYGKLHTIKEVVNELNKFEIGSDESLLQAGAKLINYMERTLRVRPEVEVAKVFEFGGSKYGESNYRKGMAWRKVITSGLRHGVAILRGETTDSESGLLHAAHLFCNILFLMEYQTIARGYDDRLFWADPAKKIILDLDGVVVDFFGKYLETFMPNKTKADVHYYNIEPAFFTTMSLLKEKGIADMFYEKMEPLSDPQEWNFRPHMYLTARNMFVDRQVTYSWLFEKHSFPTAKLEQVTDTSDKIEVIKKIDSKNVIMVEDSLEAFEQLKAEGIDTLLYDAPYNRYKAYNSYRIHSLNEIIAK